MLSGCQPSWEESFHSAPGQALSHDVYGPVTLALNQEGTHLPEEVWGEEKTGRGPRGSLQARQGEAGREIHCWSYLKREPRR